MVRIELKSHSLLTRSTWNGSHILGAVLTILSLVCLTGGISEAATPSQTDDEGLISGNLLREMEGADSSAVGAVSSRVDAGPNENGIVKVGPGYGAYWLSPNDLAYAVASYHVRNNYPYNDIVIEKVRWNKTEAGPRRELMTIPIGNGKAETSIHFVYASFASQYGYALSNADDRHGSAHGLQIGVIDDQLNKPRVYLESSYYHSTGYEEVRGVSMAPDAKGFAVSYKGDLYFIPFGDPSSREAASVSSLFHDGYAPYFDDSTIRAQLWRKGGKNYYPVYFGENELFLYDGNDVLEFSPDSGSTRKVMTVGPDVRGMSLSPDGKQLAVIRDGNLLLYRVSGELSDTIDLGLFDAQYPSWSPDGQYIAFDDRESLYVKILQPEAVQNKARSKPVPASPVVEKHNADANKVMAPDNCNSTKKLINIRLLLEAEIKVLSSKMNPALLEGLREVSKDINKLITCQVQ